jgi:hypothetical protein
MKDPIDIPPIEDHEAKLEVALVEDFLRQRGYEREDLAALPEDQRTALLKLARMHAAERLAEIGARAHYVKEIHGDH